MGPVGPQKTTQVSPGRCKSHSSHLPPHNKRRRKSQFKQNPRQRKNQTDEIMWWEMAPSKLHLTRPIQPTVVMTITIMILVSSSLPSAVHSIIFDLQSGRSKCVSEDLRNEAISHGLYRIALDTPHTHKISVRVSGPYGDNIHQTESVDSGQFSFTVGRTGPHTVCFWTPQFELSTVFPVEFEWKSGVAAKDWSDVAKKGKVNMVELELRKLEETVHSIHEEMMFLREREEEMQNLNQKTNSRMASLSLLSLFICLTVASLQLWYLKSFFERKKIL